MNKLILLLLTVFFLTSCNKGFEKTYKGQIGNKYDIMISLISDDGVKVRGFYFYENKGEALKVNGSVDGNGNIVLHETFEDKRTGVINGKMIGQEINGVWKNPNNGKELDFFVKETDINYNETFLKKSDEARAREKENAYKSLSNTYMSKFNNINFVKTEYLGDKKLFFEINVASEKCASENLKGIANIIDINKSVFKKGNYQLTFLFKGKELEVRAKGTNFDDLGLNCYPQGIYILR